MSQKLLSPEHLRALARTYQEDLTAQPEDLLSEMDALTMHVERGIGVNPDLTARESIYLDISGCVLAGLVHVRSGDLTEEYRSGSRERAVKGYLESETFSSYLEKIRTGVELDDLAKHLFVFGVALGISMRHAKNLKDIVRETKLT